MSAPIAAGLVGSLILLLAACGGSEDVSPISPRSASGFATALAVTSEPDLKVLSIHKVGETPVTETVRDGVYRILVLNGRGEKSGYTATLIGVGKGTTVIDGSVLLGDLSSLGTSSPSDTITLRHDRTFLFNPFGLVWKITPPINGIPVPPQPDQATNQATVAGVDTNLNGIRDDIDIFLATNYGANPAQYAFAVSFASSLQTALASPSDEHSAHHIASYACVDTPMLRRLSEIKTAMLDTPLRRGAYGEVFASSLRSAC